MTPVFVDCDNTMGLPGQEIDDGLTLLYLLGREDIELVGVSAAHGNGSAEEAYDQTVWLFERIGCDTPVHTAQESAKALVAASTEHPGLVVLGLGALTNLAAASKLDHEFFGRLAGIYLMGGYTGPLHFKKRQVDELNFSSDPAAAHVVLNAPCPITVMSAHYCLHARYGPLDLLARRGHPVWLQRLIRGWYRAFAGATGARGFYLWDLVPAAAVGEKAFPFPGDAPLVRCASSPADLETGRLVIEPTPRETGLANADPQRPGNVFLPGQPFSRRAFVSHCHARWCRGIR
jgi:inosine-uridine nucleoside N-ribohydrolase